MRTLRARTTWGVALYLLLVWAVPSRAADQVPRQWTEMSLEDVGRSAFTLGSCEVTDFVNSFKRCLVPAIFADNFDLSFFVTLLWIESEPESDCERRLKICAGPRESPESFGVRSTGRVASAGIGKPICYDALTSVGSRSRCDEDWARTQDALASQRGVVLDMLRDAVSRIERHPLAGTPRSASRRRRPRRRARSRRSPRPRPIGPGRPGRHRLYRLLLAS